MHRLLLLRLALEDSLVLSYSRSPFILQDFTALLTNFGDKRALLLHLGLSYLLVDLVLVLLLVFEELSEGPGTRGALSFHILLHDPLFLKTVAFHLGDHVPFALVHPLLGIFHEPFDTSWYVFINLVDFLEPLQAE